MYMLIVDVFVVVNFVYCVKCCDLEFVGIVNLVYVLGLVVFVEDE